MNDCDENTPYPHFVTGIEANYENAYTCTCRRFENCGRNLRHKLSLYGYMRITKKKHNFVTSVKGFTKNVS